MIKSAKTLKLLYLKMIHVTCTAYGLHRMIEQVRSKFKPVDKVIAIGHS
jgi:hypothetical protein